MADLHLATAGESHGPAQLAVLEGLPADLSLTAADIDSDLERRRRGYGRGDRMQIERDSVTFLAGLRHGLTLGSPLAMLVENLDYTSWGQAMSPERIDEDAGQDASSARAVTVPRPGHADLAGAAKFGLHDMRNVLERSSARSTVPLVTAGAVAKRFLREFDVEIRGRVVALAGISCAREADFAQFSTVDWKAVECSVLGCDEPEVEGTIRREIDAIGADGDSAGGIFEVWAGGVCPGLGSYASPAERLDGRLGRALLSVPAVKAVEIGAGWESAGRRGSEVHDHILGSRGGDVTRPTNRAGGLEGGMTNGMPVITRAAMKPIPTLTRPLPSIDLSTMTEQSAHKERSDVEAVAAARVVGEAVVALELARCYREKFGGDSLSDALASYAHYVDTLHRRGLWARS